MSNGTETVTISKKEYDNLKKKSDFLDALEAGVDNWNGMPEAHQIMEDMEN